jgi:hypothetical protein
MLECTGFPTEDYGLYVLGNLDGPPHDEIAEHLYLKCPVCLREVSGYRAVWTAVGSVAPPANPSRNLRKRVIASVGGRTISWWAMPLPAFAGAAALVIAVTGGWFLAQRRNTPTIAFSPVYKVDISAPGSSGKPAIETVIKEVPVEKPAEKTIEKTIDNPAQAAVIATLSQDLARERQLASEISASLATAQRALADASKPASGPASVPASGEDAQRRVSGLNVRTQELERQVAQYRVLLDTERKRADQSGLLAGMLSDPSLRVVKLRATEKNQTVEGHALIAGNSQMVFYASQLPALSSNRVYQLWLIRANGQAIASAGVFTPDGTNRGFVQLKNTALLAGVTTVAVTDEPAGGSMQPTGHKWLIGS